MRPRVGEPVPVRRTAAQVPALLSRLEFWDLVEHLRVGGSTVLLASAYFDEVERCDRVVYLAQGRVVATGTPNELRGGHASLEEAFLEMTP